MTESPAEIEPQPSELHLDFLLPDNFREMEITPMGGPKLVRFRGWSKGRAWSHMKAPERTKAIDVGEEDRKTDIYTEFIANLMMFLWRLLNR